ncbi:MAG: hypothetical protein KGI80_00430 [Verrucomicrobiota bacterium]|nr:hypothetical protein [Verrucomicrobiota bacterium]
MNLIFSCFLLASSFIIDLKNPVFSDGTLSTHEGGVIQNEDLRIQAESFSYTKKGKDEWIIAEGNLLVEYAGQAFTGKSVTWNAETKEGVIYEGRASASSWFLGGEKILLHSDGSYEIDGGTLTNSPQRDASWGLSAESVKGYKDEEVFVEGLSAQLTPSAAIPLPDLHWSASPETASSPLHTALGWEGGRPTLTTHASLGTWRNVSFSSDVTYRWLYDLEGTLATEYSFKEGNLTLQNSTGLEGKAWYYKLLGSGSWQSSNEKTEGELLWDKREAFCTSETGPTHLWVAHREPSFLWTGKIAPQLNSATTLREELPALALSMLPRSLGSTGIFATSRCEAAWLRMHYADNSPCGGRCELMQELYRPTFIGPALFTPHLRATALLSTDSSLRTPSPSARLEYGAELSIEGARSYPTLLHRLRPYLSFSGLTPWRSSTLFSTQDSNLARSELRCGIQNLFFPKEELGSPPLFTSDLFLHTPVGILSPRLSLQCQMQLSSFDITGTSSWNTLRPTWDEANLLCRWTLHRDAALIAEARYRSPYSWRRADSLHNALDVAYREQELLNSPLSDPRIAVSASLFLRLPPFLEMTLRAKNSFHQLHLPSAPNYTIELVHRIRSGLAFLLTYGFSSSGHSFDANISLDH